MVGSHLEELTVLKGCIMMKVEIHWYKGPRVCQYFSLYLSLARSQGMMGHF